MLLNLLKKSLVSVLSVSAVVFIWMARSQPNADIVIPQNTKQLFLTKTYMAKQPAKTEVAAFAAGCFWGVEEEFRKTPGVVATAVGFMGGHTKKPTYEEVCSDNTGHAETVEVEYDPSVVAYEKLLKLFWDLHDPTTMNRQGPDFGSQYRSVVFYSTDAQKAQALAMKAVVQKELKDKIVTEIVPAKEFTAAEAYHQQYVERGGHAACHFRFKEGA